MNKIVFKIIMLTSLLCLGLQARQVNVSSIAALQNAINNSVANDTINLADGTYMNNTISIAKNNIVVRAATPGGVYLNGTNAITISGNYVTFSGFQFTSGSITGIVITVDGSHITLTQLNFNGYSAEKYITLKGGSQYNVISYCNFRNKPTTAPIGNLIHIDPDISIPGYHKIRYCSFQDMPGATGDNGNECIRISNGATSTYVSRTIVEYCYFDSTGPGDSEAISVKCRENVIRFCTNTNNQQANFCFRNGDNNIAYGNFFINAGGIRVKEANNIYCYNNYFENCGDGSISAPVKYVYVSPNLKNINFIHNTFVNGTSIELDNGATTNTWANNIFKKSSGNIFTGSVTGISWAGNIRSGTLDVAIPSGMTNIDPLLVLNSDSYYGLSSSSPAINTASASYPSILDITNVDDDPTLLFDIQGQSRPVSATQKDVGCDEYTTGSSTIRPLTLSDVGPSYIGGPNLPVTIAMFIGNFISEGNVKLEWTTISEINNYGFNVQRMNEVSNNFEDIGFVAGKGTTLEPQSYTFVDEDVSGSVQYRLEQIDNNGLMNYFGPIILNPNNVNNKSVPAIFALNQNYPNPFNPTTVINYQLAVDNYTTLKVYNVVGKEVTTLVNGFETAGSHQVNFNGSQLSSGMYFYKLQSGNNVEVKKLTLIK
jgi:hypothetical protein